MKYSVYFKILFLLQIFYTNASKYGDKTLKEWTWLTAHNSNLNWEDASVIADASNQKYGITKLLEYGVRGFMIDIGHKKCNFFEKKVLKSCTCEGICLCHGGCDSALLDGFRSKPFSYALNKFVDFLRANPEEIITIFLENHVKKTDSLRDAYNSIDGLKDLLFDPSSDAWNILHNGWPKINDMIMANKRLIIVDDEKKGNHVGLIPGIIRSRDFFLQNHYKYFNDKYPWQFDVKFPNGSTYTVTKQVDLSRCISVYENKKKPQWDAFHPLKIHFRDHPKQPTHGNKLFLFNHFYGVSIARVLYDSLTLELFNTKEFIIKRIEKKCNPATRNMKPNYIALDFIEKDDANKILPAFNS